MATKEEKESARQIAHEFFRQNTYELSIGGNKLHTVYPSSYNEYKGSIEQELIDKDIYPKNIKIEILLAIKEFLIENSLGHPTGVRISIGNEDLPQQSLPMHLIRFVEEKIQELRKVKIKKDDVPHKTFTWKGDQKQLLGLYNAVIQDKFIAPIEYKDFKIIFNGESVKNAEKKILFADKPNKQTVFRFLYSLKRNGLVSDKDIPNLKVEIRGDDNLYRKIENCFLDKFGNQFLKIRHSNDRSPFEVRHLDKYPSLKEYLKSNKMPPQKITA